MAFTGVAVYDEYTTEIQEDVSSLVSMISPKATRFLNAIGDASDPIRSKYHQWIEKSLLPDTYTVSTAIPSAVTGIVLGNSSLLRRGDILRASARNAELMFVTSTSATTVFVSRAYAGTAATSQNAVGDALQFLGSAVTEGSTERVQRRTTRSRVGNYVQIFREDIVISEHMENAARYASDGGQSVFAEETTDKLREALKQLERSVLMGRTNGNTIGADDAETTMAGIYNSMTTNIVSHATYSNSILNNVFAKMDAYTDVAENIEQYMILAGTTAFRKINNATASQVDYGIRDRVRGFEVVGEFISDFGPTEVMHNRWIPTGSAMVLRKDLVNVAPYAGHSFKVETFKDGQDAMKGYTIGTYGLEFRNETAHGRLDGIA